MNYYGSDYQAVKPNFGILSSRGDDGNGNSTYTFGGMTVSVDSADTIVGIDLIFANETEERFHVLGISQASTVSDLTKKFGDNGTAGTAEGYAGTLTSVSYTHLDVYKRQTHFCAIWSHGNERPPMKGRSILYCADNSSSIP